MRNRFISTMDGVLGVAVFVAMGFGLVIMVLLSPIWVIPYLIWRRHWRNKHE